MRAHRFPICLAILVTGVVAVAQTEVRISQESSPGAGDFDANVLGCISAYQTGLTTVGYYAYASASFMGPAPTLIADRSHLAMLDAADGLSFLWLHDILGDPNGGSAVTRVEVLGDPDGGVRTVADDPGDGYTPGAGTPSTVFTANHLWLTCCTDGQAISDLEDNWSLLIEFTSPVVGLTDWFAYSSAGALLPLAMEVGRRVRLDRCFACQILPTVGPVSGVAPVIFDADAPAAILTTTFEWSTSGGASWMLATADIGSPLPNPGMVVTPTVGEIFLWDTGADGLGLAGQQSVTLRLTIDTGMASVQCEQSFLVENQVLTPSCAILAPMPGLIESGDVLVAFSAGSPTGNLLTATFDYSADGITFLSATDAGGGTIVGNPTGPFPQGFPQWVWATATDVPGTLLGGFLRITVTDTITGEDASCIGAVDIANEPSCQIFSPTPFASLVGDTLVGFLGSNPLGNMLTAYFEFSVDGGVVFRQATDEGGGGLTGNPTAPFLPGSGLWNWDTDLDIPGMIQSVVLRISVTDTVTLRVSTCSVVVDVNNILCLLGAELCADCDRDGRITVLDAYKMAQIGSGVVESPAPGSDLFNACNVTGTISPSPDAVISAVDSLKVARYVVGFEGLNCCLP